MARARLPMVPHLSPEEIARRYRAGRSGLEKAHWQVLWLLTRSPDPPAPAEVAPQVGLTPSWVGTLLKRGNAEGPAGLADRRPARDGGRPVLSDEQHSALAEALQGRPDDGGLWTGPEVAADVRTRGGVAVRKQTGWRWLRRPGFSPQAPRPRNPKAATAERQREWKRRPGRPPGRAAPRVPGPGRRAVGRG